MKIKKGNGFTLVELMITVAIVSILASVSIPAYQNYVLKAQVSEAIVLMGGVKIAIIEKFSETGDLDRVMEDGGVGLGSSLQLKGRYSTVWTIQDGKVMALMRGPAASDTFNNTWITLEPHEDDQGNLTWTCDGWMVPKEWLPSTCQG